MRVRSESGVSARLGTAGRVGSRTCGFVWDRASGARTAVLNTQRRRCVGSRVTCCVVISLVLLLIGQLGVRMSGFLTFTFQLSLPFSPCVGLSLRWGMGAGREAISSGGRVLCGARAQCRPVNNDYPVETHSTCRAVLSVRPHRGHRSCLRRLTRAGLASGHLVVLACVYLVSCAAH